jgi:hypothetical protein
MTNQVVCPSIEKIIIDGATVIHALESLKAYLQNIFLNDLGKF